MRVEFEKKYLQDLYETGKTTDKKHRFQPQVVNGYLKCVRALKKATRMEDLFMIKSLNYHKLEGDKKDFSSLRVNDQYRLEFREICNPNNILEIEICSLVDITNHYK
jgi:proteic killer suppression protein